MKQAASAVVGATTGILTTAASYTPFLKNAVESYVHRYLIPDKCLYGATYGLSVDSGKHIHPCEAKSTPCCVEN